MRVDDYNRRWMTGPNHGCDEVKSMFLSEKSSSFRSKRPLIWLLSTFLGVLAAPSFGQESSGSFWPPEVAARSAVLMNATTGELLFSKEPHLRLPPASTTKVLTAMLALERLDPHARLQASEQAASAAPSRIGLHAGETASAQDLLYGLLLKSGNDAAETLAEAAGGSIYGFADMMNAKAWQIGARDSHFMNPHGLPNEAHYSTAYDLALIFRHAMNYPMFADIVRTRSATLRVESNQGAYGDSRLIPVMNHNRLLASYEGTRGGKTGFTLKARRCFVGEVDRGGTRLIVAILNSPNSNTLWADARTLLDYGFAHYGLAPAPGQPDNEPRPILVERAPMPTPTSWRVATAQAPEEEDEVFEPVFTARRPAAPVTSNRSITTRRDPVALAELDRPTPIRPIAKANTLEEPVSAQPTPMAGSATIVQRTPAPVPRPEPLARSQAAFEAEAPEPMTAQRQPESARVTIVRRTPAPRPRLERAAPAELAFEEDAPKRVSSQPTVAGAPIVDRPAVRLINQPTKARFTMTDDRPAPSPGKAKGFIEWSKDTASNRTAIKSKPAEFVTAKSPIVVKPSALPAKKATEKASANKPVLVAVNPKLTAAKGLSDAKKPGKPEKVTAAAAAKPDKPVVGNKVIARLDSPPVAKPQPKTPKRGI